jgi:hypothetical protein
MAARVPLRSDFVASILLREARSSCEAAQARRSLALPTMYGVGPHGDAAWVGEVTLQIVRDRGEWRPGNLRMAGFSPGRADFRESGSTRRDLRG